MSQKFGLMMNITMPLISAIASITIAMILWAGGLIDLTIGEIFLGVTLSRQFLRPITFLSLALPQIQTSLGSVDRIVDVMEAAPSIEDVDDAVELKDDYSVSFEKFHRRIAGGALRRSRWDNLVGSFVGRQDPGGGLFPFPLQDPSLQITSSCSSISVEFVGILSLLQTHLGIVISFIGKKQVPESSILSISTFQSLRFNLYKTDLANFKARTSPPGFCFKQFLQVTLSHLNDILSKIGLIA